MMSVSMFFLFLACLCLVSNSSGGWEGRDATNLQTLGFLHGSLHHIHISLLDSANAEINPRSHLLNLHTRQRLSRLLSADHECPKTNLRSGLCVFLFRHRDMHHILQTLHIHIIRILSLEEIEQQRFSHGISVCDRAVKGGSRKRDQRLKSHSSLRTLELRNRPEGIHINMQLQHLQNLVVEESHKRYGVRSLFRMRAKHH
jgi:hypothetical protein